MDRKSYYVLRRRYSGAETTSLPGYYQWEGINSRVGSTFFHIIINSHHIHRENIFSGRGRDKHSLIQVAKFNIYYKIEKWGLKHCHKGHLYSLIR